MIIVNWEYKGYYSRAFETPLDLLETFGFADDLNDSERKNLTEDQAVEILHQAADDHYLALQEVLEQDTSGDRYWQSGDVEDVEAEIQ